MKPVGGVGHPITVEDIEVLVDEQEVTRGDLVEAQAQPLRVVRAGSLGAAGDLAGETGIVAGVEQRTAGQCDFFRGASGLNRRHDGPDRLVLVSSARSSNRSGCWSSIFSIGLRYDTNRTIGHKVSYRQ